jgi:uncharacterized protein with HEPN domain
VNKDIEILLKQAIQKALDAIGLLEASLKEIKPFDPTKIYSPKEREPYDAMCDRFIRVVEICIKYFKTYEKSQYAENSDTLRDLLNRMEKARLISSTRRWMEMRDIRNRIVHDYLPQELKAIYDSIGGEFGQEILMLKRRIQ